MTWRTFFQLCIFGILLFVMYHVYIMNQKMIELSKPTIITIEKDSIIVQRATNIWSYGKEGWDLAVENSSNIFPIKEKK